MEWLIEGLRAPLVEVAELLVLGVLAAVTARVRGRQRRVHDELHQAGRLGPGSKRSKSSLSMQAPMRSQDLPPPSAPLL
jgi:hypothetical protein